MIPSLSDVLGVNQVSDGSCITSSDLPSNRDENFRGMHFSPLYSILCNNEGSMKPFRADLLMVFELPQDMFVDLYDLERSNMLGNTTTDKVIIHSRSDKIDYESLNMETKKEMIAIEVIDSGSFVKEETYINTTFSFPLHLRYQSAVLNPVDSRITLKTPQIWVRKRYTSKETDKSMDNLMHCLKKNLRVSHEVLRVYSYSNLGFIGNSHHYNDCINNNSWLNPYQLTYNLNFSENGEGSISFYFPVGDVGHYDFVLHATFIMVSISTLLLFHAIIK